MPAGSSCSGRIGAVLTVNLFDPAVRDNPFPSYARMRSESPVARIEPGGFYGLTRHADVSAAFRDTETFSSQGFRAVLAPEWVGHNPVADSLLLMDPPVHTKHRTLVSRAFGAKVLAGLEQAIEASVDELLGAPELGAGEVDIVDSFAMPLAGAVVAEALGLERELAPRFQHWTSTIARITPVVPAPELIAEVKTVIDEQNRYFNGVIDARMATPSEDLPGALCRAEVDGERLTRAELISFMFLLVGAGFETTVHLLSKSAMFLAENPDVHAALREDPSRVPSFVEEMLRFDGPTHMLMRLTTREVELHGVTIPAHSALGLVIGAANRDPEKFEDPESFQLGRKVQGGMAFGHGAHVCVGMALARIEGRIAIRELTRRFSKIELSPGPRDWNYALHVRGLNHLPLRLLK